MAGLYEKLTAYGASDAYPFHMPGHKRRSELFSMADPFSFDITEIDGFDNLHHAEGILLEEMENAARIYGAEKSYFLVNGSSCGILAAISACVKRGGRILIARNCHKSAYHAMLLRGIRPVYLWPETMEEWGCSGRIAPEEVRKKLTEDQNIQAIFLTSPTYEGICSDIGAISGIAHEKGIPLIVDAAHGAHFAFGAADSGERAFPEAAIRLGADVVIESLHKTLPSLTQTAILHKKSEFVREEELEKYLQIYQTSSPSYVLMASIDRCIRYMASEDGAREMAGYAAELWELRRKIRELPGIRMMELSDDPSAADYDPSKLVLMAEGLSGGELYDRLRLDYQLQPEMHTERYVILMTAIGDKPEGFHRLFHALVDISAICEENGGKNRNNQKVISLPKTIAEYSPAEADEFLKKPVLLKESCGSIAGEFAYIYPPGIPILVPGERITEEIVDVLCGYLEENMELQGIEDKTGRTIQVLSREETV